MKIYEYSFCNCFQLRNITLSNNFTEISDSCFRNCYSLETVVINSNRVASIGEYSFQNCYSLKSIIFPGSLQVIKKSAFAYCYNLTELSLPDILSEISERSFFGCISLLRINLPKGLIVLGNSSFSNCTSLKEIIIQTNCSFDQSVFENCNNIENLIISYPNDNIYQNHIMKSFIKSITFDSSIKEYSSLAQFENLENINIFTHGEESIINDYFTPPKKLI